MAYMFRDDKVTGDAEFLLGENGWLGYEAECGVDPISGLR
jgi:hypothetical protein